MTIYESAAGGNIKLTGADVTVSTDADNLTFDNGDIVLSTAGTTTISTGATGGNIQIDGKIDGTNNELEALVISSGSGSTTIDGAIGSGNTVTTITIGSAGAGTIELLAIGDSTGVGATGAVAVGNTATATLTLDGTVYNTDDSQTYEAKAGQNIDITGASPTFTTTNDAVAFNTAGVDLTNGTNADSTYTINTGTGAGAVTFGAAVESDGGDDDTLTITSGTGTVTFTGAIGATEELGGLNVNASAGSGTITFTSDIGDTAGTAAGVIGTTNIGNTATTKIDLDGGLYSFSGTTTFEAKTGETFEVSVATNIDNTANNSISFSTGTINLLNGANIDIDSNGGAITVGSIMGTSSETVILDAINASGDGSSTKETVNITGDIGNANEILSVTVEARDGLTLTGGGSGITIDTADDTNPNIALNATAGGDIIISGTVTVTSNNTTNDGTLNIGGPIEGAGGTDNLTLESGTGTLTLSGAIGADTALDQLDINTETGTATISISGIGDSTDGSENAGAGIVNIGNASTANVTFSGAFYRTDGAVTVTTSTGGSDQIDFTGSNPTLTTSQDAVEFVGGDILLGNGANLTIQTNFGNPGSSNGGNITVAGAIAGSSNENLTLTTGTVGTTGNVSVHNIGAGGEISTIAIRGNGKILLDGSITTSDANGDTGLPSLTLTGPVELQSNTTITTDTTGTDGIISFTSSIDSVSTGTKTLTIDSGTAATTVSGNIGTTKALAGLQSTLPMQIQER